ncbi:uncharacterized protein VP01_258g6 [Puccinia sorghi]|uniref:REJ domain-containing protein n=1 Tax=Puccinia sorghi TaxID=27349 RepID=A0A0L6V4V6_9BASI|nr:uncharacterized protein VP01_258g6 [Puccinia sorghi]
MISSNTMSPHSPDHRPQDEDLLALRSRSPDDISRFDHGPEPDDIRHDLSVNTPTSSLIDVLNQWEKIPRTAEVPSDYLEQLKQALVVYEEQHRPVGSNVSPSEPPPRSHTLSSSSYEAIGSQQSRSSERYATSTDSYGSYANEFPVPSTHHQWAPFSERSRIPASRQLKGIAEKSSAELQEPCKHLRVPVLVSPERTSAECKDLLGIQAGIRGEPTTACKSLRRSPRQISFASELTRTPPPPSVVAVIARYLLSRLPVRLGTRPRLASSSLLLLRREPPS